MLKLLILILILPLITAANCNDGDGCDPTCPGGDKDCTCPTLNGHECSINQDCQGTLLKNYGNKICCSEECKESTLKEDAKVLILNNENIKEPTITPQVKKKISIGFLTLFILIMFGFYLRKVVRRFNQ